MPELDGLRALAAFSVAAFHCRAPFAGSGFLGVDVFFVLSGWLITGILAREIERTGRADVGKFMARRMRRLYPALLFMVICLVSAAPSIWPDALAAATYTMDFFALAPGRDHSVLHTWSLAIEAQFYLLWPFALTALLRLGRAKSAVVLALAWLAVTLARFAAEGLGVGAPLLYFTPVFHCTGLLLGSALALAAPRLPFSKIAGWTGLAAVLVLFAFNLGLIHHVPHMVLVAPAEIAAAVLILAPPKVLAWRPLVAFGKVSYGFYLWHFLTAFWPSPWTWQFRLALTLLVGLALATFSWWLVERRWLIEAPVGKPANDIARGVAEPSV